jgi:dTDP-4-dehydrorhamnose reductase/dTDP-4-dehydrorhamnose 3,5-epimerase
MVVIKTEFKDLYIIKPNIYNDDRGHFLETFNEDEFKDKTGLEIKFVQDNESESKLGVLRGLHYQEGISAQSKLVRAVEGLVLDVVVDMRPDSDMFGKTFRIVLSSEDKTQLFIPKGFAHGFISLSKKSTFAYKCDNYYSAEFGVTLDAFDPSLNIDWVLPKDEILRSEKDAKDYLSWDEAIKKKVLVIGIGQLGKCIMDEGFDNEMNITYLTSEMLDITNEKHICEYFKKYHYDYVVNGAAYTNVDKAEVDNEINTDVNAWGPFYLATACKKYNMTFIHISSDYVFDGTQKVPYTEKDKLNPLNNYGKAKAKAEFAIEGMLDKYYILRTSWLFSEHGNNFVKTILKLGYEHDKIEVVGNQVGKPTYAGDLALFILVGLIMNDPKAYGLYHFAGEDEVSWYEFANIIIERTRMMTDVVRNDNYGTVLAERPRYSVLDTKHLEDTFRVNMQSITNGIDIVIDNFDN